MEEKKTMWEDISRELAQMVASHDLTAREGLATAQVADTIREEMTAMVRELDRLLDGGTLTAAWARKASGVRKFLAHLVGPDPPEASSEVRAAVRLFVWRLVTGGAQE